MNNGLVLGATSCWATSKTSKGPFDRLVGGHLIFEPTINWFRGYSFIFRNVRKCGESPFVFFWDDHAIVLDVFMRWFFTDSTIGFITMIGRIYGGFLKWCYPQNTPKWSFLVGKPMVVGETHHFWKPPYLFFFFSKHQRSKPKHVGKWKLPTIWILLD